MDGVVAEQADVALAQILAARIDEPRAVAPVEGIVLAAGVDADRGPHAMVVRPQVHARRPHDLDDGELGRNVEAHQFGALGRQRGGDRGRLRHRPLEHRLDRLARLGFAVRGDAVADERVEIEHRTSIAQPDPGRVEKLPMSHCPFGEVAQLRDETAALEGAQRPLLLGVDDQRLARLAAQDEAHDAVVAGVGAGHDAIVAIDGANLHAREHDNRV